ncbi:MAG TPA: coproporphyrinogen dehydrogenase HemZ [Bacilli bacterium]|nr:coproporphyrinogen dehydrogenase HemZ [Bacilli bacterium]
MKVGIDVGDLNVRRETDRLVQLFLEQAQLVYAPQEDEREWNEAVVHIELRIVEHGADYEEARAELVDRRDGQRYVEHYRKPLAVGADDKERKKKGKSAILHVLHEVLSRMTGDRQPWGILSGVRPMKLVHKMREQGLETVSIRETLLSEYLISEERVDLLLEIEGHQVKAVPDLYEIEREVSIYIGIPFCPTHCAYCTFPAYSMEDKATYAPAFLDAMEREFAAVGAFLREHRIPVTSVYLGGGTPTSLLPPELTRVMEMLYREIPDSDRWREFSVEAGRPDTITPERIEVLRRYGVNRISVNPQTYKAQTLKVIGRGHTPDIVDKRFHLVKEAGFENINMDTILGLPGETVDDVRYTLERIQALDPDSFTVHTLQFKRTAEVNKERDAYAIPETPEVRQMMRDTQAWAREMGYHPYYLYRSKDILGNLENIGYAKPGKESVYNITIMEERQTIIGIGGGASTKLYRQGGFLDHVYNPKEPKAYVDNIENTIAKKIRALEAVYGFDRDL